MSKTGLRQFVAEALGWRWERIPYAGNWDTYLWRFRNLWTGQTYKTDRLNLGFDEAADEILPDWPNDADAALSLIHGCLFELTTGYVGPLKQDWRATIDVIHIGEAPTPAEAIAKAWLARWNAMPMSLRAREVVLLRGEVER